MLFRALLSLLLNAVALVAADQLFDSFYIEGFGMALLASFILGVLNILVKPLLILFTLPITVLTMGLFLIVINAVILMFSQALVGDAFVIDGFGTALIAAIVISLVNMVLNNLVRDSLKT